jgi:hypothetical protein
MNISSAIKTAKTVITANSPVLLVGTAIAGVVTTGVLAAKAGYKARGIIDEAVSDREAEGLEPVELTLQEKASLTWLCYASPVLTGASTIAAVVGVHTIHTKRHTAMAGLYAITSTKLDDYQEKAEELLGPKKSQVLRDDVAQKAVDRHPINEEDIILTGKGTEIMIDEWTGRSYYGSVAVVESAINEINRRLIDNDDVDLNDYYELLGLPEVKSGDDFGWSGSKISAKFGGVVLADGRSAISTYFHQAPKRGLDRV